MIMVWTPKELEYAANAGMLLLRELISFVRRDGSCSKTEGPELMKSQNQKIVATVVE